MTPVEGRSAAGEMFGLVLERVRKVDPRTADKFPENPEGYQVPMRDMLQETVEADPDFAAELKALVKDYDEAAQAHAAATGTSYNAILEGSGAIAQGKGSVAASGGSVVVGENVGGSISTGSGGVSGDSDEDD